MGFTEGISYGYDQIQYDASDLGNHDTIPVQLGKKNIQISQSSILSENTQKNQIRTNIEKYYVNNTNEINNTDKIVYTPKIDNDQSFEKNYVKTYVPSIEPVVSGFQSSRKNNEQKTEDNSMDDNIQWILLICFVGMIFIYIIQYYKIQSIQDQLNSITNLLTISMSLNNQNLTKSQTPVITAQK